jgi:hypothetical protein
MPVVTVQTWALPCDICHAPLHADITHAKTSMPSRSMLAVIVALAAEREQPLALEHTNSRCCSPPQAE